MDQRTVNQRLPYTTEWVYQHCPQQQSSHSSLQTTSAIKYAQQTPHNTHQTNENNRNGNSKARQRGMPSEIKTNRERCKRNRTIFNAAQLDALAKIFVEIQYPDVILRKKIAQRLEIDEERIQIWFQNRRAKTKRGQRKSDHEVQADYCDGSQNHNSLVFTTPTVQSTAPLLSTLPSSANGNSASSENEHVVAMTQQHSECSKYSNSNAKIRQSTDLQGSANYIESTADSNSTRYLPNTSASLHKHSFNGIGPASKTTELPSPDTCYTQHYISNEGSVTRVVMPSNGRSTEGRLRPETKITTLPPNRVCTAIPDKDKNELSTALFRFGLAIGQSAGIDTSKVNSSRNPTDPKIFQTAMCQKSVFKKRKRFERSDSDSDMSSDPDDPGERTIRKCRRGPSNKSGPPNRVATAVPLTDRMLPTSFVAQKEPELSYHVIDKVPDTQEKTCSKEEEKAHMLNSPFSVDILSSPEPISSPAMSPSSTKTSSFSDWTDHEDAAITRDRVQPNTEITERTNFKSCSENHPYKQGFEIPYPTDTHCNTRTYGASSQDLVSPLSSGIKEHPQNKNDSPFQRSAMDVTNVDKRVTSLEYNTQQCPTERNNTNNTNSNDDSIYRHTSDNGEKRRSCQRALPEHVIRSLDSSPQQVPSGGPEHAHNLPPDHGYTSATHYNTMYGDVPVTLSAQYPLPFHPNSHSLASHDCINKTTNVSKYVPRFRGNASSSTSEENRRNQVSQILVESRLIADRMPSSPASPWSGDSCCHSPQGCNLSFRTTTQVGGLVCHPHTSMAESEQKSCSQQVYETSTTSPILSVIECQYDHRPSARMSGTSGSSHVLVRPVAKLQSKPMRFQSPCYPVSGEASLPMQHTETQYEYHQATDDFSPRYSYEKHVGFQNQFQH